MGRTHELYDVHCKSTRWWVMTQPTNLYLQNDFPDVEQALIFHLGLGIIIAERSRGELAATDESHVTGAWRRYRQALTAMDDAGEAEDFQAIGVKCRDALLALVRDHHTADWIGDLDVPPRGADFKGWTGVFAERLANDRVRSYAKTLADKTWDIAVALQHNSNATPYDAELVLDATGHLLSTFGRLIRRQASGPPERCSSCGSYKLDEDLKVVDEPEAGFLASTVCVACRWRSEPQFTKWTDHVSDEAVATYLARPTDGPSDRLGRA